MKPHNLTRAAAFLMSVFLCASAGSAVSAESVPQTNIAYVSASAATAKKSSFSIPLKKVMLSHDGQYRIVPKLSDKSVTIKYKSGDRSVVKVSKQGLVAAVGTGKTTVTCTGSDGTVAKLNVTVAAEGEDNFPTDVYFTGEYCTVAPGETVRPSARISPKGCLYYVNYYISDESVATVDKSGYVTGIAPGTCTLTIVTNNGLSDYVEIVVAESEEGTIEEIEEDEDGFFLEIPSENAPDGAAPRYAEDKIHININEKIKPSIYIPDGAAVHYSSSDTSIVKVSSQGTVMGIADGSAEVTAVCGDYYDSITVYVGDTEEDTYIYDENGNLLPSRIEYEHSSDAVKTGNKISPSIKVYPKGAAADLTFTSSNDNVARVSQKGNVLGVSGGTCEITARTSNGCTATFTVTVYDELFKGIDVSKWNGDIDWEKISRNPEVNFVMIRASYGFETEDIRLKQNAEGCEKYGIPYGFYHYMYAKNVKDAMIEADFFLKTIRPYNPTYPIVLDVEESYYEAMTRAELTAIVSAFMDRIENAGYYAMIYSSATFYEDNYDIEKMKLYDTWVACWGDKDRLGRYFSHSYGMWQYSEKGRIDGIPEDTDLNYCFKNYPYLINKYNLTGRKNKVQSEDNIEYYTEVYEVEN